MNPLAPTDFRETTRYPRLMDWQVSLDAKFHSALEHFYTTNYDQSSLFHGNLYSFGYILAHYGETPHVCAEQVQQALINLLGKYFQSVDVSVSYKDDDGRDNNYALDIAISISDRAGDTTDYRRRIQTNGVDIVRIFEINNDQTTLESEFIYRNEVGK